MNQTEIIESLQQKIEELEKREKQLEGKLHRHESLYSSIMDALPINIFLEDPEGRTIFANQQACKMNGKELHELAGKTVFDFFPPAIAKKQREIDLEVWKRRSLVTKEVPVKFQDRDAVMYTGKTIIHLEETNEDFMLGFGLDITDRVVAEKLLRQSEERFRNLVEQAGDCIFLLAEDGKILNVNTMASHVLGVEKHQLIQKDAAQLFLHMNEKITNMKRNPSCSFEDRMSVNSKAVIPVDVNLQMVHIGESYFYLATCRDISEKKKAEEKISHMAYHDALTGLPNRWFIESRLQKCLEQKGNTHQKHGIFLLDLDRFKVINDSLGHQAGDILLQAVANRLKNSISGEIVAARFGGDEFILLVPKMEDADQAFTFCQKIMHAMEDPFYIDGQKFNISASIGISLCPLHGNDMNTLIKNADLAMYQSKERGRNCYTLFTPTMKEHAVERMDKEIWLRNALEKNEFILHYQPKMDLVTGSIYGMEALIRWQGSENELLYPDSFIPLAEETGLIVQLGEWVLREACSQCKKWHEAGLNVSVSVNLSARQFHRLDLEKEICTVLEETGLPPSALELELTESTVMKEPAKAAVILQNLKSVGITISIDDFGTGFSSLNYLKQFPIDILKIDKSFIRNLEWDDTNASIAAAVVSLAQSLKLKVVAEGIETAEQMKFLQSVSCNFGQGYLISKPVPPNDAIDLVNKSYQPV